MPGDEGWLVIEGAESPEQTAIRRAWEEFEAKIGDNWAEATEEVVRAMDDPRSSPSDVLDAIKALADAGYDDDPRAFLAFWQRLQRRKAAKRPTKASKLRKRPGP